MTTLSSILNSADRAAVIEANFEILDFAAGAMAPGSNIRIKDGQLQVYVTNAPDPTKPWYPFGADGSTGVPVMGFGVPVAE